MLLYELLHNNTHSSYKLSWYSGQLDSVRKASKYFTYDYLDTIHMELNTKDRVNTLAIYEAVALQIWAFFVLQFHFLTSVAMK